MQALIEAARNGGQHRLISQSCYALLLFGVPNDGLEVNCLRDMVKGQPNSQLIKDLEKSSSFLLQHKLFWRFQQPEDTRVISIYETQPTSTVQVKFQGPYLYWPLWTDVSPHLGDLWGVETDWPKSLDGQPRLGYRRYTRGRSERHLLY